MKGFELWSQAVEQRYRFGSPRCIFLYLPCNAHKRAQHPVTSKTDMHTPPCNLIHLTTWFLQTLSLLAAPTEKSLYPYGAIFFQSIQRVSMKSTVMECSNMSAPYFPCNDRCYLISSVHKGLQYRFQLSLGAYPQIEGRPGQPHQQQRMCCKWNANAQHCR